MDSENHLDKKREYQNMVKMKSSEALLGDAKEPSYQSFDKIQSNRSASSGVDVNRNWTAYADGYSQTPYSYGSYGSYGYPSYGSYGSKSKGSKTSNIKKAVKKALKKKCKSKKQCGQQQPLAINMGCGDGASDLARVIEQSLCKPPMAINLSCDKNGANGTKLCCPQPCCPQPCCPQPCCPQPSCGINMQNGYAPSTYAPNANAPNGNARNPSASNTASAKVTSKLCDKIAKRCCKKIDKKCCDKIAAECCKKIAPKCDLIDTNCCDKICVKCCDKPNCCDKLCVNCCDNTNCCDKLCVKCCDNTNYCDKLCVKCRNKPGPSASEIMSKVMKHMEATCYKSCASNAEKVKSKLKKAALRAKYELKKRSTNTWKQNPYLLFIMGVLAASLLLVLIGFLTGTLSVRAAEHKEHQHCSVGAFKNRAAGKFCGVRGR